ncbi:MAG: hypothetical protein HYU42_00780, partial [Candidatus Rokubacteria bacterium]|nr:hypothetical protein [Candidatus Rokubacteria bacterium]
MLAADHGPAWPGRLGSPLDDGERQTLEEDPFAAQWGYLSWLFRNALALRKQMQLRALTGQACEVRNELANYRPLQFAQFRRLWEQMPEP